MTSGDDRGRRLEEHLQPRRLLRERRLQRAPRLHLPLGVLRGLDRSSPRSQDDIGALSASLGYTINENFSLTLDGQNLNDPMLKYYARTRTSRARSTRTARQYYLDAEGPLSECSDRGEARSRRAEEATPPPSVLMVRTVTGNSQAEVALLVAGSRSPRTQAVRRRRRRAGRSRCPRPSSRAAAAFRLRRRRAHRGPADDARARRVAAHLAELVARTRGIRLAVRRERAGRARSGCRSTRAQARAPEGYRLEVTSDGVDRDVPAIRAGLFYGAHHALAARDAPRRGRPARESRRSRIEDAPRFAWRGLMLDSARHYQSPEFIRRFIDWMALHKLNVLHWHLTDDQGWRLEIRKYPRAHRGRRLAHAAPARGLDRPASRACTAASTRRRRCARSSPTRPSACITIVPEIEMPGHAQAAIAAYPRLGDGRRRRPCRPTGACTTGSSMPTSDVRVPRGRARRGDRRCSPASYIHVGGDEVVKDQWRDVAARAGAHARARPRGRGGAAGLVHRSASAASSRRAAAA